MNRIFLIVAVAAAAFSYSSDALAYLDPGTGSMLLQLLLGGVAGVMVVGKLYWDRLKRILFGSRRNAAVQLTRSETNDPDGQSR